MSVFHLDDKTVETAFDEPATNRPDNLKIIENLIFDTYAQQVEKWTWSLVKGRRLPYAIDIAQIEIDVLQIVIQKFKVNPIFRDDLLSGSISPELHNEIRAFSYLVTEHKVRNAFRDARAVKRGTQHSFLSLECQIDIGDTQASSAEVVACSEIADRICSLLDADQRRVFSLRQLSCTNVEIANAMRCSIRVVERLRAEIKAIASKFLEAPLKPKAASTLNPQPSTLNPQVHASIAENSSPKPKLFGGSHDKTVMNLCSGQNYYTGSSFTQEWKTPWSRRFRFQFVALLLR
jgi:hypothetical protein